MKKIIMSIIVVLFSFLLSACSIGPSRVDLLNSEEKENKKDVMQIIVDAVNEHDSEALISLFSENALEDEEDFGNTVEEFLSFFDGQIVSWEDKGSSEFSSNDHGIKKIKKSSFLYLDTIDNNYFIYISEYLADTKSPENIGCTLLILVEEQNRLRIYDKEEKILKDENGDIDRVGFYIPFEKGDTE